MGQLIGIIAADDTRASDLERRIAAQSMDTTRLDPFGHEAIDQEPLRAVVVDLVGSETDQAKLIVAKAKNYGVPILALFRLAPGSPYRVQRENLLKAGAADVVEEKDDGRDLLIRLRSLCHLNEAPHILVVDDEKHIRDWAEEELTAIGMRVSKAATLAEARAAFSSGPIDALVVDRNLPDGDGKNFVAELRDHGVATPAMLYTALNSIEDRVSGLEEAGADDYLCKPAHGDELRARVRVLLRPRVAEDQLVFGPLALHRRDRIIRWRGDRVEMRPRETAMLIYLAERAGLQIPQQMLYLDIWEKIYMEIGSNPVSATKHRMQSGLKKFVEARGETCPEFIETGGNCYAFKPESFLTLAVSDKAETSSAP